MAPVILVPSIAVNMLLFIIPSHFQNVLLSSINPPSCTQSGRKICKHATCIYTIMNFKTSQTNTTVSIFKKPYFSQPIRAYLHKHLLQDTLDFWFLLLKNWSHQHLAGQSPSAWCFHFITTLAHFNLILSSWYMGVSWQAKFIWVQASHFELIGRFPHYPGWSVDCVLFIFLITKKLICKGKIKRDSLFSMVRDGVFWSSRWE